MTRIPQRSAGRDYSASNGLTRRQCDIANSKLGGKSCAKLKRMAAPVATQGYAVMSFGAGDGIYGVPPAAN
jgi:hypothetical protein